MALVKLGNKAVGSIVKLNVDGVAKEFIVVHQGLPGTMYDASCDGTWVLIKDCYEKRQWHRSNVNDYANSDIHKYLNRTILNLFDVDIRASIKQVKIPYRAGNGYEKTVTSGAMGLLVEIFLLSAAEVNVGHGLIPTNEGACLSYFNDCPPILGASKRITTLNGSAYPWWLRSPACTASYGIPSVLDINLAGKSETYTSGSKNNACTRAVGIRFAMILPKDLWVSDDGTIVTNTPPSMPSSITIPSQINGGSTITVEWGAASDAEGNLEGYKVERSLDGGTIWAQIYQGPARSITNLVPFGSGSVMYRVKAYDTEGLESGWKTSAQITVINNTAPTVPGFLTVPEQVQGGQTLAVAWGASTDGENNLAGYSLERQVDGGDWAVVYSGGELDFTDAITKGWQTVAYRVRAFDVHSAYSGFAVSETRAVNNNTPPAIICEYPANTSLGVKNQGFEIPYSVSDEEGDEVTVTESVDGTALRTFSVELGAENRFALGGVDFMRLLNGRHALSITAADGASKAVRGFSFEKLVTSASVTLEKPMSADGPITVCVLSVSGSIPLDAEYKVEVTNNGLDAAPVWEDCTAAVRAGVNHIFENTKASTKGFAFNFRLNVSRGESGVGGYITSVQGGFQ